MRWLRRHALVAPFGVFAVTALLVLRSGQWSGWESLSSASSLVDLGAVLYGMLAVLVERGVRMVFWALDERRKWREKRREEAMAEGRAEGRAEGQAELIAEMLAAGVPDETKQALEQWALEKGIPLDKHPRK